MAPTAKHGETEPRKLLQDEMSGRAVDQFAQRVAERVEALSLGTDRSRFVELVKQALCEARGLLDDVQPASPRVLPVSKLKASDVVSQGWVDLSQATLYRAAEAGRFYCTTRPGRSIGKEFPVWQFVEPVTELIAPILSHLAKQPSSAIHAFWVTAVDELNELSPAEVLAGKPFETRKDMHHSQQAILELPASLRVRKVKAVAVHHLGSMVDTIG